MQHYKAIQRQRVSDEYPPPCKVLQVDFGILPLPTTLAIQKRNDEKKRAYAKEKEIRLIEISYKNKEVVERMVV